MCKETNHFRHYLLDKVTKWHEKINSQCFSIPKEFLDQRTLPWRRAADTWSATESGITIPCVVSNIYVVPELEACPVLKPGCPNLEPELGCKYIPTEEIIVLCDIDRVTNVM